MNTYKMKNLHSGALSKRLSEVLNQLEAVTNEISALSDEFQLQEKIESGEIKPEELKDFMRPDDEHNN